MTTLRVTPSEAPAARRDLARLDTATHGGRLLRRGDTGPAVEALQRELKAAGFFKGPVTGFFGPITQGAVKDFERAHGRSPDGRFGVSEARQLKGDMAFVKDRFETPAVRGQRGSDVLAAEKSLKAMGLGTGNVDGLFTGATQNAVKELRARDVNLADGSPAMDRAVFNALRQAPKTRRAESELRALGYKAGKADGIYDATTQGAVKAFQRKEHLTQSGQLDAATTTRLDQRAAAKAAQATGGAKPHGEAAKAAWYQGLVNKNHGHWRTGVNQMNIVGLRGQSVDGKRNHNEFNRWNDTIAYVWKGTDGKMHVREFQATTDPGRKGGDGQDANHDGRLDVAHLRPGSYPYHLGSHHGVYGAGNPNYNLQVDRDTNHDGNISTAERAASKRRDDRGSGINIHWGDGANVDGWSLGCQVIKGSQGHFRSVVTPLMEKNRGQMYYTLIDQGR